MIAVPFSYPVVLSGSLVIVTWRVRSYGGDCFQVWRVAAHVPGGTKVISGLRSFGVVTPCSAVDVHRRFRGPYRLHL